MIINHRKLNRIEQAMETLNSRAKTWNILTISRIQGPLTEEIIRQALDILQYRHHPLNYQIVPATNSLYFQTETTKKISLRVVKKLQDEQWQEIAHEEINQQINSSKELVRFTLIHILSEKNLSYLITTIHHAIADGLSCVRLHSEILTYCQKIEAGEIINSIPSLPLLPPLEELLPEWTKSLGGKISRVLFFAQLAFKTIWYQPKTLGFEKYTPIVERRCGIVHRQLDQELTQQFVNRCRQENTTVNSALCAAMMLTAAKKVIEDNRKNMRVNCLSYIDLRRRLEPTISDEHLAILAASVMGFYTIDKNISFWELARNVKQQFEATTKHNNIFNMMLIANNLIDFCFKHPKQVIATVSVSNLGKVNISKTYGAFELEEISFAASNNLYAGVFITHALTFREKMFLNFVFSEPSISRETMEDLVSNFISCIFNVCTLKSLS